MFTLTWWKDAADRVISTALFALISYIIGVDHFDLWTIDWHTAANVTVLAGLGSLVKAWVVGKLPIGTPGTATPVDITTGPDQVAGRHAKGDQ